MRARAARRLVAAIVFSGVAHALLMAGNWLRMPETAPVPPALEARLVPLPPPVPAAARATRPKPAPRPAAMPRRSRAPRTVPVLAAASPVVLAPEADAEPLEAPVDLAAPEPPPEPDGPAPDQLALAAPPGPAPAPLRRLPKKGRITYDLYYGEDQFGVGRTVQTWEIADGGYRLASFSETTGIVDLLLSQRLTYLSQGRVTARGLKPGTFLMSRTRRGKTEEARAVFDWEDGTIALGKTGQQRAKSLPAQSQDIISFVYQLGLAPPAPGRIELPITNGAGLDLYAIDVLPEQEIETPLGTLRALPLKQVRQPGDESIEVWLATEYRYLPVKIRFYDREGKATGEQIVTEIRVSED